MANVSKRVTLWNEVAPFYPDQTRGLPKSSESRGTEAVLNALVLSARDAQAGVLGDDTRAAFANMWALQMTTGELSGAWAWLNFHLEPWESPASPYMGATLAATAVGLAPGAYASSADAKEGLTRLRLSGTRVRHTERVQQADADRRVRHAQGTGQRRPTSRDGGRNAIASTAGWRLESVWIWHVDASGQECR